ncbi:MAG: hypothetical protein GF411_06070 [Candidatus Lokiarchaeota archaeon]|nr:hypothetical protein [Candidatus Lokiarchaeota archaeon]
MELLELVQNFLDKEVDKRTSRDYNIFLQKLKKSLLSATIEDMIKAHAMFQPHDIIDAEFIILETLKEVFLLEIRERVDEIENSVMVLLKEHEHTQSIITVGQLNRLRGGLR